MRSLRETWLLYRYSVRTTLRNPVWVLMGLFQPVVWLLLFAPLLDNVPLGPDPPPGGAMAVFTPGILILLALYSTLFAGWGVLAHLRSGVLERLSVTPASRTALVLGRVLRDITIVLVQGMLLLGIAWLLGLRASLGGALLSLGLVVLIGLTFTSCSYALALTLRSEDGLAATLNFISQPLLLLSGILLPLALAPRWIRLIADANPFAYAVDAARALFDGDITDAAVFRGFAILTVLAIAALLWAARSFRRVVA